MNNKETISLAGHNRHTVILTAREQDGSVEGREVEPYSYKFKNGHEIFYCYDVQKKGMRSFLVSNITAVRETSNSFSPRWPIEV